MKEEQASAKAQLTTQRKKYPAAEFIPGKRKGRSEKTALFYGQKNAGKLCNIEKDTAIR